MLARENHWAGLFFEGDDWDDSVGNGVVEGQEDGGRVTGERGCRSPWGEWGLQGVPALVVGSGVYCKEKSGSTQFGDRVTVRIYKNKKNIFLEYDGEKEINRNKGEIEESR